MQESETGLFSNPIHKSKLEMDQRPDVSQETIKPLEDNIGKNLLNINMSNLFLNASPSKGNKSKTEHMGLHQT